MPKSIPEYFFEYKSLPQANIYYCSEKKQLLIQSVAPHITGIEFKEIFTQAAEAITEHKLTTCIFDKRSLLIFHQPSLFWYYRFWKPQQLRENGLVDHRKIMPNDELFRSAVRLSFESLKNKIDTHYLNEIEIRYFENIEEATAFQN